MRQILIFIKKEFLHIFRDRKSLLIIFALPIAQITIFGFALTNEIKNSNIAILDHSNDDVTQQITEKLDASRYFQVYENLNTDAQISDALKSGKVKMVVVFPPDFKEDLFHTNSAQIQLIADASDPNTATTITFYATNIIHDEQNQINADFKMPYQINPEVHMLYNPELKGAFNFVPGVMGMILLLICAMMTSIAIVREKELNTMEVILASPLKPAYLIISKAVPYIFLSLINVTSILIISSTLLDVPIRGNLLLIFGECFLFITVSISFGLMISNFTNSQQTAMFISQMGLMLPTLILSGFMFPIENMPKAMQLISNIVPTKWFFIIIRDVMIKGLGFFDVWRQTLIMAGMAVFFLSISLLKFKKRLE